MLPRRHARDILIAGSFLDRIGRLSCMKARFAVSFWVVSGLLASGMPALAHHSCAAEYDSSKPVTHAGVVTRIDWMNPHVYIYIDEKSPDGKIVNWGFEGYPHNTLRRVGLSKSMLKIGDSISVTD